MSTQLFYRVVQAESRCSQLSSNYDSLLSARLELEAKVESASDERRSLLERCLGAESELERSRSTVVELRRKLDDSQAALHELGRENQSIQVKKSLTLIGFLTSKDDLVLGVGMAQRYSSRFSPSWSWFDSRQCRDFLEFLDVAEV